MNVEVYRTNGLMLAIGAFEARKGLSSGEESDFEGKEVHGYLPTPSEVPVSEIGDADSPIAPSDSSHESDDDAAPGFSAGLLQGQNKCSSTISRSKSFFLRISLHQSFDIYFFNKSIKIKNQVTRERVKKDHVMILVVFRVFYTL